MATDKKCRGWVGTINYGAMTARLSYDEIQNYVDNELKLSYEYFCYDEEQGDTGNLHVHFYIEFLDAKTFSSMSKKFPAVHLEPRKGTPTEARNYVMKPVGMTFSKGDTEKSHTVLKPMVEAGDFSRLSKITRRGEPEKLSVNEKLKLYVEKYDSLKEIEDVDLWFAKQYKEVLATRFIAKKEQALFERIGETVAGASGETSEILHRKVYYLHGESRAGKTYGVKLKYGSKNVYTVSAFDHPFDDYEGQRVLHLDEFRSDLPLKEVLVMLQGYREDNRLSARYYNGVNLSDTIILSTNLSITQQYAEVKDKHPESWQAFYNRFNAGIWEMVYSEADDTRYISCVSAPGDYSPGARASLDFSIPPVDINKGVVWVRDPADFCIAKRLIKRGVSPTLAAIQAEKDAAAEPIPDDPFA